jgi:hypothetical protein
LPISAVDSITPALEHTKQQLFRRFSIGQWTRLALVGLLAGELGSNGCNRSSFPGHAGGPHLPGIDPALIAAFITAAIVGGLAIGLILMYVSSVMRFILFDSVLTRECHIRMGWNRRMGPGWRFFLFKLVYAILSIAGIAVVVGIPALLAFGRGWFQAPREHLPALIIGGLILGFVVFLFFVITAVIFVLTKDFVIPQMALENIGVMEGWRRLWLMMQTEAGAYFVYVVMKIVLAIVTWIVMGIATLIVGLMFAVPSLLVGIVAVISGKRAGLTWNAETITLAIVIGCILLAIFLYLVSLIYVPAIVFFPAYSIYFFAGRYPRLSMALYGTVPAVPPGGTPAAV